MSLTRCAPKTTCKALVRCDDVLLVKDRPIACAKLTLVHSPPLKRWNIQVETGYTGRRVTNTRFKLIGTEREYFSGSPRENNNFIFWKGLLHRVVRIDVATQNPRSAVVAACEGTTPLGYW